MDDDTIVLDMTAMDLGEMAMIEDVAGPEAAQLMMEGRMTAKAILAVVYVIKRRDNPAFTLEDAKAIKVSALKQPDDPGKVQGNGA